jgi:hypothetical protein
MTDLPPMPLYMQRLPIDPKRNVLVPAFVTWLKDGVP